MNLNEQETEAVLYCVTELVDRRARAGVPIPAWMHALAQRFDLASLTSPRGHESDGAAAELEMPVLIGSSEAADIIGVTARQVRRLRADLAGEKVGGRMVFNLQTVKEYAEERVSA